MHVHVAGLESDQRQTRVRRSCVAPDQHGAGQAAAVLKQSGRELDVPPPDEPMVHTGSEDGDCSTRSAPRTYVVPATSSSTAGKRVRTRLPSLVTTTSSS